MSVVLSVRRWRLAGGQGRLNLQLTARSETVAVLQLVARVEREQQGSFCGSELQGVTNVRHVLGPWLADPLFIGRAPPGLSPARAPRRRPAERYAVAGMHKCAEAALVRGAPGGAFRAA